LKKESAWKFVKDSKGEVESLVLAAYLVAVVLGSLFSLLFPSVPRRRFARLVLALFIAESLVFYPQLLLPP
jgi:hypothetical protein